MENRENIREHIAVIIHWLSIFLLLVSWFFSYEQFMDFSAGLFIATGLINYLPKMYGGSE